ncbi:MAG: hypothetical protein COB26_07630 [Piscirickettsiaceae bacterium]|nr:MAG: hypothetical protein COB26_07630 [Piscirickettsiaceae bacterium]
MSCYLKLIVLIISGALMLVGCDGEQNMGSNPLRAQAREIERQQQVKQSREQETQYGSDISKATKDRNK